MTDERRLVGRGAHSFGETVDWDIPESTAACRIGMPAL